MSGVESAGPLPDFYPELIARIRARLVSDPDHPGCLVCWSPTGRHGRIRFRDKLYSPHRVLLEAKLGHLLPQRIDTCHECDHPPCCADAHLWAGTRAQNAQDAVRKGRMRPPPPKRALSPEAARALRVEHSAGVSIRKLAGKHGLAKSAVQRIVAGETYRDTGPAPSPTPSHNREALR